MTVRNVNNFLSFVLVVLLPQQQYKFSDRPAPRFCKIKLIFVDLHMHVGSF